MNPMAVSKAMADFDKRERTLRRALGLNPSVDMFDVHRKVTGQPNIDLLTGDAANALLASVTESPACMALFERAGPLMDRAIRGVADPSEERGVGRVLKQREELEAKLIRATGSPVVMHELGHLGGSFVPTGEAAEMLDADRQARDLNPMDVAAESIAEAAPGHDFDHIPFPEVASDPPGLITGPPIVVPQRRPIPPPAKPLIVPADLAEVSAGAEARSNRIAVEAMLRDNDLDHELEHLEVMAVRLVSGTNPDRVHAAMSASLLFGGVADFVLPGKAEPFIDRNGDRHLVEKKHVRNRISAYIDMHMRDEISTHDARRLQAKIDYAHTWSAEGHHVAYSAELANRAYRDLLEVLAYVARAQDVASR